MAARLLTLAGVAAAPAALLSIRPPAGRPRGDYAFALQAPARGGLRGAASRASTAGQPSAAAPEAFPSGSAATSALVCAALVLLSRGAPRSRLTRNAYHTYERKWWSVEETRDPTTLPLWQRDFRFGYQVLKRTMVESRKKGKKVFWDVRVIQSTPSGCEVEMLNSGLIGFCPRRAEGYKDARLNVGDVVKMECTACPQKRVHSEKKPSLSPWPQMRSPHRIVPLFSHYMWLEQQLSIKKAKKLEQDTIIDAWVFKHTGKGLVMALEDGNRELAPKGMLAIVDISRKMTSHEYVDKMFPKGTKMKVYVIHADAENGRITLGTKEFEDDDHMGWMLSFPERCMARAEEGVRRYHEKRDAYIKMLQR